MKDVILLERNETGDVSSERLGDSTLQYSTPEALFRARNAELVRLVTFIAGSQEAAEDALQEAFIQLCLRWRSVRAYDDPVAWVRRVAINRLRNRERSMVRRARALFRLQKSVDVASQESRTPLELQLSSEMVDALRMLPPRQRSAVVLYYLGDLSVADIAISLGITQGAVNRHLNRGRESLRRRLEAGS